jgi:hypothetical protein
MINAYKILDRKPGGKRRFGRPRQRYYDNIKTELKQILLLLAVFNVIDYYYD